MRGHVVRTPKHQNERKEHDKHKDRNQEVALNLNIETKPYQAITNQRHRMIFQVEQQFTKVNVGMTIDLFAVALHMESESSFHGWPV